MFMATENLDMDYSKYDFKDSTEMYVHLSKKGLSKRYCNWNQQNER